MIRSMTGFSRQDQSARWGELALELRAVNHRYLELSIRLPEELRALDPQIRKIVGKAVSRGKIDIGFKYSHLAGAAEGLHVNQELVGALIDTGKDLSNQLGGGMLRAIDLLRWPGVVVEEKQDAKEIQTAALALLKTALADLIVNRTSEGERLKAMLLERCHEITGLVSEVRSRLPDARSHMHNKLKGRLAALEVTADEGRLETEIALMLNKADIAEELDRLDSHVVEALKALDGNDPVGRRLDFLMQEFNREANTLASKSQDAETTRVALELKVLVEQMREQVQNIE